MKQKNNKYKVMNMTERKTQKIMGYSVFEDTKDGWVGQVFEGEKYLFDTEKQAKEAMANL